jgi:hypothetical protein
MTKFSFRRQHQGGDGNTLAGHDVVSHTTNLNFILSESESKALKQIPESGWELASHRIGLLASALEQRFVSEESRRAFGDPDTLFNLIEAQTSAARSGSQEDIDLIVDLLALKVSSKETSRLRGATSKALEVVGHLDTGSLAGLTALWYAVSLSPAVRDSNELLSAMNSDLGPLTGELPRDDLWLGDLVINDCITGGTNGAGRLRTFPQIVGIDKAPMMICQGLPDGNAARTQLTDVDARLEPLVIGHPLDASACVLLGLRPDDTRDIAAWLCGGELAPAADPVLSDVISQLAIDRRQISDWENKLSQAMDGWPNLSVVRDWLAGLPAFRMTSVGIVIAYANLKRVQPNLTLPTLDSLLLG